MGDVIQFRKPPKPQWVFVGTNQGGKRFYLNNRGEKVSREYALASAFCGSQEQAERAAEARAMLYEGTNGALLMSVQYFVMQGPPTSRSAIWPQFQKS